MWQKKKKVDQKKGTISSLLIQVAKGTGPEKHHVDALAGATLTSNGVDNLVKFWMGEAGFAPFLRNLTAGEA